MSKRRPGRPKKTAQELRDKAAERRQRGRAQRAARGIRQLTIEVPDCSRDHFKTLALRAREGQRIDPRKGAAPDGDNEPPKAVSAAVKPELSLNLVDALLVLKSAIEDVGAEQITHIMMDELQQLGDVSGVPAPIVNAFEKLIVQLKTEVAS